MNALFLSDSPSLGGAEQYLVTVTTHLRKNGINITALTNNKDLNTILENNKIDAVYKKFRLDVLGGWKGLLKFLLSALPTAIKFQKVVSSLKHQKKIDMIITSGFSEKILISLIGKANKIPVVWFEYAYFPLLEKRNLGLPILFYKWVWDIPKRVVAISNHVKDGLKKIRLDTSKVSVIYCGTDLVKIKERKKQSVVGNISRVVAEKGQEFIIKAIPVVIKKHPQTKFIIAGTGPDLQRLKSIAKKLKVSKSIEFMGYVKNREDFFNKISIFAFTPSWELEGFSLALAEAMMHSLPIIASNIGVNPEIIENDKTGILVAPKDENSTAKAIIRLLDYKKFSDRLALNARTKASKLYNIDMQINKIAKILNA